MFPDGLLEPAGSTQGLSDIRFHMPPFRPCATKGMRRRAEGRRRLVEYTKQQAHDRLVVDGTERGAAGLAEGAA